MVNYKKFVVLLLIFSIHMMPFNLAYANNLGGWTITNSVSQGASTLINATKNVLLNGSNVVKTSTAVITPTAAQVAKALARGAGGYALAEAVNQLLGAVDWVLDAENNAVVYKENGNPLDPKLFFKHPITPTNNDKLTASQACAALQTYHLSQGAWLKVNSMNVSGSGTNYSCVYNVDLKDGRKNIASSYKLVLSPQPYEDDTEEKSIPLETVATQVISNAESGNENAKGATRTAALDSLSNDESTQSNARSQLETNARTQTSEEAQAETTPKDPTAPELGSDIAIKFPVFCSWAPTLCEAAQKVITFPNTLVNWWDTSTKSISESWTWIKDQYKSITDTLTEFFKENPNQDTNVPVDQPPIDIDTSFNFGGQCPAPITFIDSNMMGVPFKIEFSFTDFCFVLESFVRPVMYALSAFIAILIYSGVRTNNE
ncbi:hypothetical protein GWP85_03190 [Acinetobacter beijerinckii]|uniref:virulence factor TspB C-terminal domain-related protein n=1 Tax=Acinetobacter beijerinckii TaxID=262668 RepID=UPI0023DD75AA|nr:virulence factor TspB C-terminal domain-related protein [Acinetobacter beijerinckii]MDF2416520.1 hypothetical protein [Acinetobacter beijerinckii]